MCKMNEQSGKRTIRVLVVTCAHMVKTAKGDYYTDSVYDYEFFKKYLQVFDEVKVVARCKVSEQPGIGAVVASGENVRIFELPEFKGIWGLLKKILYIRKLARNAAKDCDCIVYRVPQMESYCIFLFNKYKIPYAVEVTSDPLHYDKISGILKKVNVGLLRHMCKNANGASYVTEKYLQSFYPSGKNLKPESNKFESYYSSIVLPDGLIGEPKRYSGIPGRTFTLVHVANAINNPCKGHYTAVQVIAKLVKAGKNVMIKFIGEGEMVEDLKRVIAQLKVENNVLFIGRISDKQALFEEVKRSDLMLFPTSSEGLPRSIIEAQAVGVPVVSTPVGGIPELVEEKYLRQPDDVDGFTDLIISLMDNPQELEEMSKSGLVSVSKYTESVLAERRNGFYAQLRKCAESRKSR